MLKQYLTFFIYGFFIFYVTLVCWGLSAGIANWWPYVTLLSSILLFVIASSLSMFYRKSGSIIGLIGLLGTTPFLVNLISEMRRSWNPKEYAVIMLFAVFLAMIVCFVIGTITSISVIINSKQTVQSSLKKPVRIGLASIPLLLFTWWIITVFVIR